MTDPPDERAPELERVVDAISDGAPVEWEAGAEGGTGDPETLAALRLIEQVARVHRGGSAPASEPAGREAGEWSWGRLRILGRLGSGVYGEVYRAFDPGLRREVALKLWSATVRPLTIERLLDEARSLARVRQPNVLVVHGADVHDGRVGMWTELLEGSTLEELITNLGPGHWREAALYGIELCRALAAVHAIGFVHRDVKAANVMRERGGRIVLMDFGSAGQPGGIDEEPGACAQGTPLAMAPEVLGGAPATAASDLYSLGVLLFRLVASRYPIEAGSLEELRAKLAESPLPSLRTLRPEVPLAFARVVERALERDPGARPASAIEMERLLAEALSSDWYHASPPGGASRGPSPGHLLAWMGAATVAVLALAGLWWLRPAPAPPAAPAIQFTLEIPAGEHLPQYANVAISPDGASIAFASVDSLGRQALWIRRLDSRRSMRLPGTGGARYPFWSPDSRNIAFFCDTQLKRVGIGGDSVHVVCAADLGRGGSWSRLGTILFAGSTQGPLFRVSAGGGTPMPATVLDTADGEVSHRWPCFLPDGDHFLYAVTPTRKDSYGLYVGSLHSDRRAYVGPVESAAVYSSGLLVYVFNQTLEARPFSVRTLRWAGDPVPVSDVPVLGGSLAEPHASMSANGTLVTSSLATHDSHLEWVDTRDGSVQSLAVGPYFGPSVSPDGRRIACERVEGSGRSNIWMVDTRTGAAERWTDDTGLNRAPKWSPSGDSIVFSSNRSGSYELYVRSTGGPLAERRIYAPPHALLMWPGDWRRGGLIAFDQYEPGTAYNVYEMRPGGPVPIARTAASEMRAALSPDRRWLAYDSNASGRTQIYLLDRSSSERFVLPDADGTQPRWALANGQLFYHTAAGVFFERTPIAGRRPDEWPARRLFRTGVTDNYDVDPAGRRVLLCLRTEGDRPEEITVFANLPQAVARGL